MSPWTIKSFDESLQGVIQLKEEVLALGFVLTEEENKLWEEFKEQYQDDDDN